MNTRSHQGNTDRKNRRVLEPNKAIRWDDRKMADLKGHTGKSCQFIAGEDHYMCGAPGFPYCPDHYALCHQPVRVDTTAEGK